MTAGELAERLGALAVTVEDVRWRFSRAPLDDYPGGRPSTILQLSGQGQVGFGELVAFSEEEHGAFSERSSAWLRADGGSARRGSVRTLVGSEATPYERSAHESALVDLAMRQGGHSLEGLMGSRPGRMRWVSSFGAAADPRGQIRRARTGDAGPELKLDVHPDWMDEVIAALRADERVVILDFKERGSTELARRLSAAFPQAIFEDPPEGSGHLRVARDRSLARAEDVRAVIQRGEQVNLKGPRMGGFLELLRGLDAVPTGTGRAYFGGMFEVGPGREQARQLAAIFCPEAPNDLAPFHGGASSLQGESPSVIRLNQPGFGATLDWRALSIG